MANFSIIIPIYQAEKWLERCLNSVMNQTYDEYEVLMIDDGSTDDSYKICQKFQEKDRRFIAVHQENGGVSSARNKGLDLASKEYVVFVDADDSISSNYLSELNKALQGQEDVCICTQYFFEKSIGIETVECMKYSECKNIWDREETLKFLIQNAKEIPLAACSNCYRLDFLRANNILFCPDYIHSEDLDFSLAAFIHMKRVTWLEKACYFYNKTNENSATYRVSYAGLISSLQVYKKWFLFFHAQKEEIYQEWATWLSDMGNSYLVHGASLKRKERMEVLSNENEEKLFYRSTSSIMKRLCYEVYLVFGYKNIVPVVATYIGIKNRLIFGDR